MDGRSGSRSREDRDGKPDTGFMATLIHWLFLSGDAFKRWDENDKPHDKKKVSGISDSVCECDLYGSVSAACDSGSICSLSKQLLREMVLFTLAGFPVLPALTYQDRTCDIAEVYSQSIFQYAGCLSGAASADFVHIVQAAFKKCRNGGGHDHSLFLVCTDFGGRISENAPAQKVGIERW